MFLQQNPEVGYTYKHWHICTYTEICGMEEGTFFNKCRYLDSSSFSIDMWCVHGLDRRTNNDCEGWHRTFNKLIGKHHLLNFSKAHYSIIYNKPVSIYLMMF